VPQVRSQRQYSLHAGGVSLTSRVQTGAPGDTLQRGLTLIAGFFVSQFGGKGQLHEMAFAHSIFLCLE
jgi:hypothetical protein